MFTLLHCAQKKPSHRRDKKWERPSSNGAILCWRQSRHINLGNCSLLNWVYTLKTVEMPIASKAVNFAQDFGLSAHGGLCMGLPQCYGLVCRTNCELYAIQIIAFHSRFWLIGYFLHILCYCRLFFELPKRYSAPICIEANLQNCNHLRRRWFPFGSNYPRF